jgi:hypothetical protein
MGQQKFDNMVSHSIGCGNDDTLMTPTISMATDARDMVKELRGQNTTINSFGCNTDGIKTNDMGVGALMQTNECGSQAQTRGKDVMCNTQVNTVTQACQKEMVGHSKEVSCMILRPEDLNPCDINDEDLPDCFRCDGRKINKKGLPCKRCNATGKLNNKFFKDLNKMLQVEVKAYCTQQYQRLMIEHLEKKKQEQMNVIHENVICDGCDVGPIKGIRYKCTNKQNYDLCEKCEANVGPNSTFCFLKIRKPMHNPLHLQCEFQQPNMTQSFYQRNQNPRHTVET